MKINVTPTKESLMLSDSKEPLFHSKLDKLSKAIARDPYSTLLNVLNEAYAQASEGKGKERHAKPGEKFEDQKI